MFYSKLPFFYASILLFLSAKDDIYFPPFLSIPLSKPNIDLKPVHKIYPDELEDIFYESLDKDFNTQAEDGSVEQV